MILKRRNIEICNHSNCALIIDEIVFYSELKKSQEKFLEYEIFVYFKYIF